MSSTPASDEQLIIEFRNSSDQCILDELVKRHIAGVRAMIYTTVLSNADADDLTQEVFLRAIRGLNGFQGRARFSTWLHSIAVNLVRTFIEQRSRNRRRLSAPEAILQESVAGCLSTPIEADIAKESQGRLDGEIEAALGFLTPKLRTAVALIILQGMNPREAAELEGCTTATMYWRIHRAKNILKSRLRKMSDERP